MKSINNMIVLNLILFVTILMLSVNCGGPEVEFIDIDDTTDVSGIHFLEYDLDSVNKKWGYDGNSKIYSAPTNNPYGFVCGIKVRVDSANYDTMKIQENENFDIIDSIRPSNLNSGDNYHDIYTNIFDGNTQLDIYGGNPTLRGMSDYYGDVIDFYYGISYDIIDHAPLKYYLGTNTPNYNPDTSELKNEMNKIIHQAVVHVSSVEKTVWDCSNGFPYDLVIFDGKLTRIFAEDTTIDKETEWIKANTDRRKSCIVHVEGVRYGWQILSDIPVGGDTVIISKGSENAIDTGMYIGIGPQSQWEPVVVQEVIPGIFNNTVILANSVEKPHSKDEILFEFTPKYGGIAICDINLGICEDDPKEQFIVTACHEFMHLNANGHLDDIYDDMELKNLMYYRAYYSSRQLKYETTNWIKQWNDAHNGP